MFLHHYFHYVILVIDTLPSDWSSRPGSIYRGFIVNVIWILGQLHLNTHITDYQFQLWSIAVTNTNASSLLRLPRHEQSSIINIVIINNIDWIFIDFNDFALRFFLQWSLLSHCLDITDWPIILLTGLVIFLHSESSMSPNIIVSIINTNNNINGIVIIELEVTGDSSVNRYHPGTKST